MEERARASGAHVIYCNGHSETINPVLGGDAECDIRWEDLQIGERIGIGKNFYTFYVGSLGRMENSCRFFF